MGKKDRLDKFIERKLGSYRFEYVKRMEEKIPAGMLRVIQSYRVTRIISTGCDGGDNSDMYRRWYLRELKKLNENINKLLELDKPIRGEERGKNE